MKKNRLGDATSAFECTKSAADCEKHYEATEEKNRCARMKVIQPNQNTRTQINE
jgi:hypothetical protein